MKRKQISILALGNLLLLSSCINKPLAPSSSENQSVSESETSSTSSEESSSASSSSATEESSSSSKQSSASSKDDEEWDTNYSEDNVAKNFEANKNVSLTDIYWNTPSVGTQPILVLPITFTDKTFTTSEINEIKILTQGEASETKYWESLKSYYNKSSYGKLNLEFTYGDPVSMEMTAKKFYQTYGEMGSSVALKKAVKAFKSKNGDSSTQQFDLDRDGYIDSVIMIYAQEEAPSYDQDLDLFWAYRYWDFYDENGDMAYPTESISSPVGFSYFWSSLNFFYEATGTRKNHTGIDAHTLIHEFGHMLGADDYYNSDENPSNEPSGAKLMMSNNVLDHDAFNKFQFNWVKPTYVSGSAEVTIHSFESTGEFILLSDKNGWNETAFDEYVLIELFTPTGLNELDSKTPYSSYKSTGYNAPGVRMWHVDNRLAKANLSGETYAYYSDNEVKNGNLETDSYHPEVACANGKERDTEVAQNKNFDSLTFISSKGSTFSSGNFSMDKDLFHEGDVFSLCDSTVSSKYSKYFANSTHLNNGNELPFKVEISSLSSTEATIKITEHK